ncbi:MAG: bifunctional salicylyl-CoA 5-hydroxylase/oxidoreductase [Planctomycetes bacterium]|nr:bifunctional salicylyl-CoA 5-hydroxylase/oxidoreductase [Planctomycetota bacterium]
MKITSIGGGPAGLYFSILIKRQFPSAEVTVYERNGAEDTFGFGVVFSDETLSNFQEVDPESYHEIRRNFAYWTDIDTYYNGELIKTGGNGFCGIPRVKLLQIMQERCAQLGVKTRFNNEIVNFDEIEKTNDLVLAADGLNSLLRAKYESVFRPRIRWGKCKFSWLGTTLPLRAFTFIFRENEHGLWQIHAYPYDAEKSTFIVECHESVWKRAGFDGKTETDTVAYFEKLFADHLQGHRLLTNRSIWRTFPTIQNEAWHHKNIVLMGDAAHTAHFSIGSGTKLAMEDAIALAQSFKSLGPGDVPRVLAAYEENRKPATLRLQKVAQTSREWFENCNRYKKQPPLQFTFNLMTRSKQITYDNLRKRDETFVAKVADGFAASVGIPKVGGATPAPMFAPFKARDLILQNRVVVSPMCQYSAEDGTPNDWHLVHLGARAVGAAGLVFTEATDVSREGRITHGCAGMYKNEHVDAWKRIVTFVHAHSQAKIGMQLAHAGRKGSCKLPWEGDTPLVDDTKWTTVAPSAEPFAEGWHVPRAATRGDMDQVKQQFVDAVRRCESAGFDLLELHMAHGYLLSSFLSPLSNIRKDDYGGSLENRMRFPLEVFDATRAAWPLHKPIFVRISATDWLDDAGGQTAEDSVAFARALREHGCDVVDVSSAGNSPASKPEYGRMYQLPFAEKIRYEANIPVMAVGNIQGADHVNTIVAAGRADLCAIARGHLMNPHLTLDAASRYNFSGQFWPPQYLAAKPRS